MLSQPWTTVATSTVTQRVIGPALGRGRIQGRLHIHAMRHSSGQWSPEEFKSIKKTEKMRGFKGELQQPFRTVMAAHFDAKTNFHSPSFLQFAVVIFLLHPSSSYKSVSYSCPSFNVSR